jgi:L-alanine-DL-glutamate epimerase-like enolase superfamily enzyme
LKITAIRLDRMRLPLDPPFHAAWDPVPRRAFGATLVRVTTDEGVTGYGSGDTMDGFAAFEGLFPCQVARHVRTLETVGFHASRYWPLEAALWDITGKVAGLPVAALFGGAASGIPAYASFGEVKSPQERAEAVLAAREAGLPCGEDPDRPRRRGRRPGRGACRPGGGR